MDDPLVSAAKTARSVSVPVPAGAEAEGRRERTEAMRGASAWRGAEPGHRRGGYRGRRPADEPPGRPAASQDTEPDTEPDAEQVARSIALRLLASMPRSRAQLAEAMARKDVPSEIAERVLDRLEHVGLVDDAEYAAMLVRTKHAERGLARRALAQELSRRGIDRETAASALEAIDREDEDEVARELVRRRAPASANLPRDKRVRRLVGMLARKGHSPGGAYRIVTQVLDAEEGDR